MLCLSKDNVTIWITLKANLTKWYYLLETMKFGRNSDYWKLTPSKVKLANPIKSILKGLLKGQLEIN